MAKSSRSAPTAGAPPSSNASEMGTSAHPWILKTPSGQSDFTAHRDEAADPPALVVQVGKTELRYRLACLDDLAKMLRAHGDWALWAAPTSRSPRLPVGSRPGLAPRTIRSRAGMG